VDDEAGRDVLQLHDGETVRITTPAASTAGTRLEVEAEWRPIDAKPFVHLHPAQDERFEVTGGELSVEMDGEVHVARAGETIEVPRGVVHSMWNSGAEPTRARWIVTPALRTEDFFRRVDELRRTGPTGKGGMPTLLASGMLMREFSDEVRLPLPGAVSGPLSVLLSSLARLRGYPAAAAV
jgi:mannose-6-phosphate isomerase-like protein (cupin superfamily)